MSVTCSAYLLDSIAQIIFGAYKLLSSSLYSFLLFPVRFCPQKLSVTDHLVYSQSMFIPYYERQSFTYIRNTRQNYKICTDW